MTIRFREIVMWVLRAMLVGFCFGIVTTVRAAPDGAAGLADRLEASGLGGTGIASPVDLHATTERLANGAKGHVVTIAFAHVFPSPPDGTHLSDDDALAWATFCGAAAIVAATFVESDGLLTTDKRMIFTRSLFRVDAVLKRAPGIVPGARLAVVRPGGTVVDDHERLSVVYNGGPAPLTAARHVLELRGFADPVLANLYAASITSADDPSKPLRLSWGYERPSVDELRDGMARVVERTPCGTP